MQRLKLRHPALCEGWIIVKNKSELVKEGHNLSIEKLKMKMEEGIEEAVRQSMLEMPVLEEFESGGDKEYEGQEDQKENPFVNRKTMKGEVRDAHGLSHQLEERKRKHVDSVDWEKQLENRKRKLIQKEQLRKLPGSLL